MAGNFIALCNENEEAPLVVIAGRETFVISLLTRIGYGGQFCCDAHRGALNVLPMTARHPVSCPSMCGEDQIRGSMRCGISGPLWSAQGHFRRIDRSRRSRHVRFAPIASEPSHRSDSTRWPSRPGEFHPEPLTDPDLTLSCHPARATARRLPPSIEYRVPPVAG